MVYLFTISLSTNYSTDNVESFFVFPFYNYDLFRPYLPPTPQFKNGTPAYRLYSLTCMNNNEVMKKIFLLFLLMLSLNIKAEYSSYAGCIAEASRQKSGAFVDFCKQEFLNGKSCMLEIKKGKLKKIKSEKGFCRPIVFQGQDNVTSEVVKVCSKVKKPPKEMAWSLIFPKYTSVPNLWECH